MVDILQAFTSWNGCQNVLENLMSNSDPTIAVLAIDALYRMESDVKSYQFPYRPNDVRNFLRRWRCESPMIGAYSHPGTFKRVPEILRSLTIFKTLEVPLFIDDYGTKELLSSYGERIEDIHIDGSTPIYHVTHREEAQEIVEGKELKPSKNKNIIEGCWFGLDDPSKLSVYGSRSFETTLSKLGVTCLHQGEIVSYKKEVNVILYAAYADDTNFEGLKKPTDDIVKDVMNDQEAYVKVSIFVPARFLPNQEEFLNVFSGPFEVEHGPFCVREKRSSYKCKDLDQIPEEPFDHNYLSQEFDQLSVN